MIYAIKEINKYIGIRFIIEIILTYIHCILKHYIYKKIKSNFSGSKKLTPELNNAVISSDMRDCASVENDINTFCLSPARTAATLDRRV